MKKLIALALAVLMLLASAAFAEPARVMTFSDPVVDVVADEKQKTVDLSGVSLRVAAGKPEDIPTVQVDIAYKGKQQQGAVVQFVDGCAYIQVDGLSKPLFANLSAAGASGQRVVDAVFNRLDSLMDFKLPAFTGVQIPRIRLLSLAPMLGTEVKTVKKGVKKAEFELPYAMVKQLLNMAVQYRSAVPESAKRYSDLLFGAVEGMLASDSGFALKGSITAKKKTYTLVVDIYPVEGGVTADAAAATVTLASAKNKLNLSVEMSEGGSAMNLLDFALTSSPKTAELSFSLDAMGLLVGSGSLYPQDGAQVAAMELSTLGDKFSASLTYGPTADGEFADFALDLRDQLNVAASVDASYDENGDSAGTFALNAIVYGDDLNQFGVSGQASEGSGDIKFRGVSHRDRAIDLAHLDAEQSARLKKELDGVVNGMLKRAGIPVK